METNIQFIQVKLYFVALPWRANATARCGCCTQMLSLELSLSEAAGEIELTLEHATVSYCDGGLSS